MMRQRRVREEPLEQLLEEAHEGMIQVPEFQREFMLEDEWIKSLLASVSLSFPIGAVTLLQAGNPDVRFAASPVAGAPESTSEPERLLIDGQQRIAALYQVLASGHAVHTRADQNRPIARWYSIDIEAALDPDADRDETVVSVPEPERTTEEFEWEHCRFPLRLVFGPDAELRRWQRGFVEHGAVEHSDARKHLLARFDTEVLHAFEGYLVPVITVGQAWTRWSVRVHGGPEGRSLSDRFRL
jgi:hypothetical protein